MSICRNCKHWVLWKTYFEGQIQEPMGNCEALTNQPLESYSDCRVYDDSDPIATGENFGCIHFKAIED